MTVSLLSSRASPLARPGTQGHDLRPARGTRAGLAGRPRAMKRRLGGGRSSLGRNPTPRVPKGRCAVRARLLESCCMETCRGWPPVAASRSIASRRGHDGGGEARAVFTQPNVIPGLVSGIHLSAHAGGCVRGAMDPRHKAEDDGGDGFTLRHPGIAKRSCGTHDRPGSRQGSAWAVSRSARTEVSRVWTLVWAPAFAGVT